MLKNTEKEQTNHEVNKPLMVQPNRRRSLKPMRSIIAVRSLKPRTTVSKELKKS